MSKKARHKDFSEAVFKLKAYINFSDENVLRLFNDISKLKIISQERVIELCPRAQSGDIEALNKIVLGNLRLIIKIAKNYSIKYQTLSDLVNEGVFGLITAVKKYDLSRNVKFANYAAWEIRNKISRYIWENNNQVRLPTSQRLTKLQMEEKSTVPFLEENNFYEPSFSNTHIKINESLYSTIENGKYLVDNNMLNEINNESLYSVLDDILKENFTPEEQTFMRDSLEVFGSQLSIGELAKKYHLTKKNASKLKSRLYVKLKKYASAWYEEENSN